MSTNWYAPHKARTVPDLSRRRKIASATDRPLRADAQRNYDAIVRSAGEVFAEQGTRGSLDDIAHRAGVANATLYRRFPTRDDLLAATLRYRMAELDELASRLIEAADPGVALEEWFFQAANHLRTWQGLPDSVVRALQEGESPLRHACQPLEESTDRLVTLAKGADAIRPDLDSHDVFTLIGSLAWAATARGDSDEDLRRMIRLVLEGISAPS